MNTLGFVCSFIQVMYLLASFAFSPGSEAAATADERVIIRKTLYDSFNWAATKDRELLESVISHDEDLFMFNPDSRNTVRGWNMFTQAFDIWMDPRFEATRFEMRDVRISISRAGDVAWYSAVIDDCGTWEGREFCWTDARWTGVLEKREGKWIIVQMHISIAADAAPEKNDENG